jgi:plasmid stabilization system protein ParE
VKATFHELASVELEEAVDHYDRKAPGLGQRFLSEVRAATAFIEAHPRSSQEIERKIRRKVLVKFPYDLLYVAEDDHVLILAVAHESRRPGYWRRRFQ